MTTATKSPPIKSSPSPEKQAVVEDVRQRLSESDAVLFTEYRGLNVSELAELRSALQPAGATYKIFKNTLARVAARELKLEIDEFLTGPTGMVLVKDADTAAVAKLLVEYGKSHEVFAIKGALMDENLLDVDAVKRLAKLPPRDQLLAQLGGIIQSPMSQMAGSLQAPLQEMGGLLGALHQKMAGVLRSLVAQGGINQDVPKTETPKDGNSKEELPE